MSGTLPKYAKSDKGRALHPVDTYLIVIDCALCCWCRTGDETLRHYKLL